METKLRIACPRGGPHLKVMLGRLGRLKLSISGEKIDGDNELLQPLSPPMRANVHEISVIPCYSIRAIAQFCLFIRVHLNETCRLLWS